MQNNCVTHCLHGHDVPNLDSSVEAGSGQVVGVAGTELAVKDGLKVTLWAHTQILSMYAGIYALKKSVCIPIPISSLMCVYEQCIMYT
jgi:hypothetical protein